MYFTPDYSIRRTNIPFTIACVGIDIYSESNSKKQLKVAQYITGNEKDRFPNMIIDSKNQKKLYEYYVKTLKKIWDDATPVEIPQ